MLPDGVVVAHRVVRQRFPQAVAAWLGGSVAAGNPTDASDLDITVLLDGPPAPYRASHVIEGWPVELFVQTEASLMTFCDDDRIRRRRPTTMRLVGSSIVLVDERGAGRRLQSMLHRMDVDGPPPISADALDGMRYAVSDMLDDLPAARADAGLAVAAALWQATGELLLARHRRWSGSGKWLLREIEALDADADTHRAGELTRGLRAAAAGDPGPLRQAVLGVLAECGGPLFDGYHRDGPS